MNPFSDVRIEKLTPKPLKPYRYAVHADEGAVMLTFYFMNRREALNFKVKLEKTEKRIMVIGENE